MISFAAGIFYSWGPVPISRIPLGEIFSGFFMGFVIIFISTYIHVYDQGLVSLIYENGFISLSLEIKEIINIFLISFPAVVGIANIMLANNICDIEDDLDNKRYTLPVYIGIDSSLNLFKILYYLVFLDIIIMVLLEIIPSICLLVLLTYIPIKNNIKLFFKKQSKKETFELAVKNFLLINIALIVSLSLGIMIGK
jgi:1,4-dihydroxy-2-naphthoate octaprenyltransferase